MVCVERRPGDALTACPTAPHEWDRRWWSPISKRRAPVPAREGGHRRPERVPDLRRVGPRRGALPGAADRQQVRPPGGQLDIYPAAHPRTAASAPTSPFSGWPLTGSGSSPAPSTGRATRCGSAATCRVVARCSSRTGRRRCAPSAYGARTRRRCSPAARKPACRRREFPYGTVREAIIDGVPVTMLRISYVARAAGRLLPRCSMACACGTRCGSGPPVRRPPVGIGVYGTTGRMEKGYLLMGSDLTAEYSPVEAGLARPRVKRDDFIGKQAYLKARAAGPAAKMCAPDRGRPHRRRRHRPLPDRRQRADS